MNKIKLGLLGNGYLCNIIVDCYNKGLLKEYEIVGILGRSQDKTESIAKKAQTKACYSIDELLALKPDYIAEAASVQSIKDYAKQILNNGTNLIVLSIGAFADEKFYEEIKEVCIENNTRVHIASGAIGGFDVLRTISLMGEAKGAFSTKKNPKGFKNTPLFKESLLTDKDPSVIFNGDAIEAINLMPTKVNVAVASSLAMEGPNKTSVTINSVPGFVGDEHTITSEIDGMKAYISIYSANASIAAYSVVACLRNIVSPIVF